MKKTKGRDLVEQQINERAAKDKAFRKKLMNDPHKTLQEIGINIPSSVKIHVRDEQSGTWELVLRQPVQNTSGLSDRDLKNVAAGCNWYELSMPVCDGTK
jgi:hypothetical protein